MSFIARCPSRNPGSVLIGFWWGFSMSANVLFQVGAHLLETRDTEKAALVLNLVSSVFFLGAGLCLIFLIQGIITRQQRKWDISRAEDADAEFES